MQCKSRYRRKFRILRQILHNERNDAGNDRLTLGQKDKVACRMYAGLNCKKQKKIQIKELLVSLIANVYRNSNPLIFINVKVLNGEDR